MFRLMIITVIVTLAGAPTKALGQAVEMVAFLNGYQEVPTRGTPAVGTGRFTIDTANDTLHYWIDFAGLSSAETAAHIHGPADPGVSAGAVFTLSGGTPKSGSVALTSTQKADILAGKYYVNVHSANFSPGEIRGQIVTHVAVLDGAQEGNASTHTGIGLMTLNRDTNALDYYVSSTLPLASQTVAHFHGDALHTQSAGPVITLPTGEPKAGSSALTPTQVASLDAGKWYLNLHTGTFPGGEIRGQVVRLATTLNGQQEGNAATGYGYGLFSHDEVGNQLSYHIVYGGLSGAETAAHFHAPAARGANASPVHHLTVGTLKLGIWSLAAGDSANISAGLTYVNIHTALFPGGELRGQLDAPIPLPSSVSNWADYLGE